MAHEYGAHISRKRPADSSIYGPTSTQNQNVTPIPMITPFINKYSTF